MKTRTATVLFMFALVIVFTFTSPINPIATIGADVALAQQQSATTDNPVVVQNVPKEAVPVATTSTENIPLDRGEWYGEYRNQWAQDGMTMTVTRATDTTVEGTSYAKGKMAHHNKEIPFVARREGNTFSWSTPQARISLTLVSEKEIRGTSTITMPGISAVSDILLRRK